MAEAICKAQGIEPYDLTAEPTAFVFLSPGWAERFKELAPFRAGGLTIEGTFDIEFYPGAIERLDEMTRNHPDYCSICEGFPCQGNHAPGEDA